MRLPHPIPYQGSKRNLADQILRFFPEGLDRLIEPFAGSAAITIASAFYFKANRFLLNDINKPLIELWDKIINEPKLLVKKYHDIWHEQLGNEEAYYYYIREIFNETKKPELLLFLLAKCVKSAVRYNAQGNFNQSPDKRRLGREPQAMRDDIVRVSQLLLHRTELTSTDYTSVLDLASPDDLIYMDPPYQGTGINGGFSYAGNIDFDNFSFALFELNKKNIPFILSFDGRTGNKTFGQPLPECLHLTKIELYAGRSSQATLLNRKEYTYEVIYLSPALITKIDMEKVCEQPAYQEELFASHG
ncbi:MAG: DNA adenine methylase [Bacteroidetes bacterium]|nr:MAG: DNA adenine methylase [Bacteroidota bacterium]